jgi:hypothetical protein
VNVNEKHSLPKEYLGFEAFLERNLSKLDTAYPGIKMDIEKVVSNSTDVIVFLKVTYADVEACSVHHFLVQDGLFSRIQNP